MTPLRVFLDSNILFSAAYRTPNRFQRLWTLPGVKLLTSEYCVSEVKRNLPLPAQLRTFQELLSATLIVSDVPERLLPTMIMLPTKDLPVLAAAMQCKADVLVAGDRRHFGLFYGSTQGSVRVESPEMFWQRFPSGEL